MMTYLQASWGYILMIGGLFVTWVILMILDGPAQRRDAARRQDDLLRQQAISGHGVPSVSSQVHGAPAKNSEAMTTP